MSASASSFLACSSRPALRNAPADSSRCLSWRRRIVISSSSVRGSPFSISPFFTAALSILKASTRGLSRSLIASLVSREMSSLLLTASSSYVLSSHRLRACAQEVLLHLLGTVVDLEGLDSSSSCTTSDSISPPTILENMQSFSLIGSSQRFWSRSQLGYPHVLARRKLAPPQLSPRSRSAAGMDRATPGRDRPPGSLPTLRRSILPPARRRGRPLHRTLLRPPGAAGLVHCARAPLYLAHRAPPQQKEQPPLPPARGAARTAGPRPQPPGTSVASFRPLPRA